MRGVVSRGRSDAEPLHPGGHGPAHDRPHLEVGPAGEGLSGMRDGLHEGTLVGGNLSMVCALIGTPYMPDLAGAIRARLIDECAACGKQHSLLAGTIFEQSMVPMGGHSRKVSTVCHTSVAAGGLPGRDDRRSQRAFARCDGR